MALNTWPQSQQQTPTNSPRSEYLPLIFPSKGMSIAETDVQAKLFALGAEKINQIVGQGLDSDFIRKTVKNGEIWYISNRDPR